jgi:DNA-binding NarL/FixJ family response regulator
MRLPAEKVVPRGRFTRPSAVRNVMQAGAIGYLTKPFDEESLIQHLRAAFAASGDADSPRCSVLLPNTLYVITMLDNSKRDFFPTYRCRVRYGMVLIPFLGSV